MAVIVITVGLPDSGLQALRDAGHTVLMPDTPAIPYTREQLMGLLPRADAVIACNAFDA